MTSGAPFANASKVTPANISEIANIFVSLVKAVVK